MAGAADDTIPSLDRLRAQARRVLPRGVFDYVAGGAGRETTLSANRRDLDAIALLPLTMRDVSAPDLGSAVLGRWWPLPIGFGPTALHRLVHPEGETASARAARTAGVTLTIGAMSSVAIEQLTQAPHGDLWFQTYLFKDTGVAPALVARAAACGCEAIVVTVGCPVMGYRDRNRGNRFVLPADVSPAHFGRCDDGDHNNPIGAFPGAEIDPAATWADVARLVRGTRLPVLVKGVLNARDVPRALDAGVRGIVVSNHGGRQLDGSASTISVLPGIARALDGRAALLIDGGFRRGGDVLKALALGADAVLLGRPLLWALAVGGADGVVAAVGRLAHELRTDMQLVGCTSIADLRDNAEAILRLPRGA